MIALLVVLGILTGLNLLPVGLRAQYDHGGGHLTAYLGPFSFVLYPGKGRDKTAEGQPAPQKKTASKSIGGNIDFFRELLSLGLDAMGCFRRKLRLKDLSAVITIGAQGREPAQWAMHYGSAWAVVGNMIPALENIFRIEQRDIQVVLDEHQSQHTITASGHFRLLLGELIYLVLHYGRRGFKIYTKQKGSNHHGTSHQ